MGFLRSLEAPNTWCVIKHDFLIGRDAGCDLVLSRRSVSNRHAIIRWDGSAWLLRDLASQNGTFLQANGDSKPERISGNHCPPLALGDRLLFAETGEAWLVIDTGPPRTLLVEEGGTPEDIIPLDPAGVVPVPSEECLQASLYRDRLTGSWILDELEAGPRPLRNGEGLVLGGRTYRLHVAESTDTAEVEQSPLGFTLADGKLELIPATDQESAALEFHAARRVLACERRAHLYLLAHLALQRLRDAEAGNAEQQCGWLSTAAVQAELGYACPEHLAVDVFRCRRDLKALRIADAAEIIDRRRRGHLRIGVDSVKLRVR